MAGHWWVLVVPLGAVPGVYVGLDRGWWGSGLGDGWQYAMTAFVAAGLVAAAAGVALRSSRGA